ncbi:hypothetical protein CF392_12720 [Tamilnaduibacter salinus]|uniref:Uncharacterized protein n=1 Tax=Tamilnaduibacter salinus TaxID=1484056 RepID=A0A2A2I0D1_9GAMM|nr:hypothetical protein CF392_12720 [Tamilnaduibacter salinus]
MFLLSIFGPGLLAFAAFLVLSGAMNSPPEFRELIVKQGAVSAVGQANAHRLIILHDDGRGYRLRSDCPCNRRLPGHEVTVWVEPDLWGRDRYDVWELRMGDRTLLSYGDKTTAVRRQNRKAVQIGGGLMVAGLLVLPFWWRHLSATRSRSSSSAGSRP